ncbi:MAG: hypothetical protein HC906_11035 [Bacteroidales bacterium]|nr:hypothetical protein [Bacteroidales bacterium]
MPKNFKKGEEDGQSLEYLRNTLFGSPLTYSVENHNLNKKGFASGVLTGGNLSILYSLQATEYEIDTRGKLLFIEEVNENLYHVERMLINLKMSGKFKKLAGLIMGGFTDMKDTTPSFGQNAYEIISTVLHNFDFPVIFGLMPDICSRIFL